jgi:protein-tyrosine kinase
MNPSPMNFTANAGPRLETLQRNVAATASLTPMLPPAALDLRRLALGGHLVPGAMEGRLAEELRVIKQALLHKARGVDGGSARLALVMVTSALPGEGKTTLSINLAMSLAAEIDRSVLLVDVDTASGTAMRRLGVDDEPGLMDLLTNPALPLHEAIRRTDVPRLSVLPAGRRQRLPTELLASRSMDRLLERLLRDFPDQIVVFDAPPLLTRSEAKVLASHVGQVLMVVEACRTPVRAVARAFACLAGCPEVTSVLNRARREADDDAIGTVVRRPA